MSIKFEHLGILITTIFLKFIRMLAKIRCLDFLIIMKEHLFLGLFKCQ
jgi:hypothetical protein